MEATCKKINASHAGLTGSSHVRVTGKHNSTAYLALTSHTGLTGLLKKQSRQLDTINSITRVGERNWKGKTINNLTFIKVKPGASRSVRELKIYGKRLKAVRYHADGTGRYMKTVEIIVYNHRYD